MTAICVFKMTHEPSQRFYIGCTSSLPRYLKETRKMLNKGAYHNKNFQLVFTSWEDVVVSFEVFSCQKLADEALLQLTTENSNDPLFCNRTTSPQSHECGAYTLTHVPTGFFYIGSTSNIKQRLREHRSRLADGTHHNVNFLKVFTGWDDVAVDFAVCKNREVAYALEQLSLDRLSRDPLCCNVSETVENNSEWKGKTHSKITREKIAESWKNRSVSDETRQRMSSSGRGSVKMKLRREISIDGKLYSCVKEAALELNLSPATIRDRIAGRYGDYPEWRYTVLPS